MGKNKRSKLIFHDDIRDIDVEVDSAEEWHIYAWVMEAVKLGIVKEYDYQPPPFKLSESHTYMPLYSPDGIIKERSLVQDHEYTSDFKLTLAKEYLPIYWSAFKISNKDTDANGDVVVWFDVKGKFNKFDGGRILSIHQKLVYEKYGVYINKIVPVEFFRIVGVPKRCRYSIKTKKISHIYDGYNYVETMFKLGNKKDAD